MQAFGPLIWIVEAAVAVFMILDGIFSANDKQVQAFNSSIDSLKESTKTATDVNEKYKNSLFNSQALIAYGTALTNVSNDINNLVKTLQDADKYASWWDRHIVDNIKVLWGGNLKAQFTKNIASGLEASVKAVPQGPLRTELENKLKGSLGTLDFQEAFAGMSNEDILKKGAEVSRIVSSVEQIVSKSKTLAQNVKETNKAAQEAFLNFSNAVFKPTQMQTFLASTTKEVVALKEAFQDSLAAPVEFQNVLDKVTKLEYFSPEVASQLSSIATQFNQINEPITKQRQEIERITKEIERVKNLKGLGDYSKNRAEFLRLSAMLPGMEKALNDMILKAQPEFKKLGTLAAEQMGKEILARVDYVLKETQLRLQQINNQAKQATLAALPAETETTIRERTRLQLEAINIETSLRNVQQNLITSVDLLRVQMEIRAAEEERKRIEGGRFATEEARQTALTTFDTQTLNPLKAKAKAMGSGDVEGMKSLLTQFPDLQSIIQARQSVIVSNAEANAKRADVILQGRLKQIDKQTENSVADINQKIKILEEQGKAFDPDTVGAKEAAVAREQQIKDYKTMIDNLKSAALMQKTTAVDLLGAGVKPEVLQSVREQLQLDKARLETTSAITNKNEQEKLIIEAQVAAFESLIQKYNIAGAVNAAAQENSFNARKQEIDYQKEQLNIAQQNGAVNQDDFNQRTRLLALRDAELERDRAIYAQGQRNAEETLQWRLKVAQAGNVITENLQLEIDGIKERNVTALTGIANQYNATRGLIDLNYENNTSQMDMARKIGAVFEGVTDKMTDAFMKFAETGKLSFKDLANSVISDIARIIIRMQILNMMESMFGKGFASSGGNWLTDAIYSAAGSMMGKSNNFVPSNGEGSMMVLRGERRAKGAAYTGTGIEMYAKGGMFTNSVVAEPTMFKFAKGVGMMGEAGPEAIMPLRRDSDGNLGVIAQPQQQGKVEVVVNNFSGEKAETRETVDSRGNRKIEVVVGEMVASEMGRKNSPLQQSMMSNFVTRPATVRR
jgi:lambda family phage tail tape measure protein